MGSVMTTARFSCQQFVIIAALLGLFGLGGCAQYQWIKPGATPQDFQRDHYNCMQAALRQAPPAYQTIDPSGGIPTREKVRSICRKQGGVSDCSIKREQTYDSWPMTSDLNEPLRGQIYAACLGAAGWQQVRIDKN